MKVYITKYALTKGIQESNGKIDNYRFIPEHYGRISYSWNYKPDWHIFKEDAIKQAEKMRLSKIISLKKQLNKLENLKFE